MKLFSCQSCQQMVFFENVSCTSCGHVLGFAPDRGVVCALEPVAAGTDATAAGLWRVCGQEDPRAAKGSPSDSTLYRQCRNQTEHAVCNWLIPSSDPADLCRACRLNHTIPNLGSTGPQGGQAPDLKAKDAWHRLEMAKRRLIYALLELGLPVENKAENPSGGLAFDFLQDGSGPDGPRVFTGHSEGVITINIAEADDPFREKMRLQMGETYRTLLGHFRHEIGHYYWERLISGWGAGTPHLARFRELFGDEQQDYAAAQQRHYSSGPPPDWTHTYVSAYASMHPWEDWAESWAHYLHIVDTLDTARAFSLSIRPRRAEPAPVRDAAIAARQVDMSAFDELMAAWTPLTVALNALNRSMGMNDVYPFVLHSRPIEKLRFVHEVIGALN